MNDLTCGDCGEALWVQQEEGTLRVACMKCHHVVSQTLEASLHASYEARIAELARAYDETRPSVSAPALSPAWQPLFDAMGIA